jgi:hypothetical protein
MPIHQQEIENFKKFQKIKQYWKNERLFGFHKSVRFPWPNSTFNTSLIPFLSSLPIFFGPNDAFLQVCFGRLNGKIFQ